MKRALLSLALVGGAVVAANAQSPSFGVKAGASLTSLTGKGTDNADLKYRFGFLAGVLANLPVNDLFSVQPEVLYSMKGAKGRTFSGSTATDAKLKLDYIDVPVLAHINAGGLFFELGPQVGFLVSAKAKGNINGQSYSQDVKDQLKKVDFGYAAGLGYQMADGPGVGLRYNGGFVNLDKNSSGNSGSVHNSAFQLYLTYMVGGK